MQYAAKQPNREAEWEAELTESTFYAITHMQTCAMLQFNNHLNVMCAWVCEVPFFHFHNKCEINWYICGLINMHILNKIVYTVFFSLNGFDFFFSTATEEAPAAVAVAAVMT